MGGMRNVNPELIVVSTDGRLLRDPDPITDFVTMSNKWRLAFTETRPVPLRQWRKGTVPGWQPDPPDGTMVFLKIGDIELPPDSDQPFWTAKDTIFLSRRNTAARGEGPERFSHLRRLMQWAAYSSGAALAVSFVSFAIRSWL